MQRFLHKKWLSIPVMVVLIMMLTAGVVLAAGYNFLSFTTNITVAEPLLVEYNFNGTSGMDDAWHSLGDLDSQTIEASAGDIFKFDLRIQNRAEQALTVDTVVTGAGNAYFTLVGFPNGVADNVPASDGVDVGDVGYTDPTNAEWFNSVELWVNGNCPVNETGYDITFTFTRE